MTPANFTYGPPPERETSVVRESDIESGFIETLRGLKYSIRSDIRDRASLEANFREKFEALNRVKLTESEFQRLLEEIVTPDVFTAAKTLREINAFIHDDSGNGYIWHTTGSGKTLTSFKASTLLKDNPDIEKCLFVVDRKDLDRQTREEFNKFQEGCVEENTNTAALVRRLRSEDYADKVIVTTIQKLGLALDEDSKRNRQRKKNDQPTYKELLEPLQDKRIVFIFDECHRSQFGENHQAIKEFFPKAQLFGFTGTPIFEQNASLQKFEDQQASMRTTEDLFQKELHAYTITHAIEDGNVLRFHVDYFRSEGKNAPKQGQPLAKAAIVNAILDKHDAATGGADSMPSSPPRPSMKRSITLTSLKVCRPGAN